MSGKATPDRSDLPKAESREREAASIDADDSPEWTDEMFDRAEVRQGDRPISRGRWPDEDDERPQRV
ncbi:hypothetical protein [Salinarimonas rosea]|uniref:hypothetical protein n=1 Tax=Salinarimonas rosea TaxID=552063 RepID=UPI0003F5B367|nr:hypothetical protein [Salinarimonas rosea]